MALFSTAAILLRATFSSRNTLPPAVRMSIVQQSWLPRLSLHTAICREVGKGSCSGRLLLEWKPTRRRSSIERNERRACQRRGCAANWPAPPISFASLPHSSRKARGSTRGSIPHSPTASRCRAPTFVRCSSRSARLRSFGASNFPLAFSVAGGDTASALAAGNPVIVKAHPGASWNQRAGRQVIRESVRACGLPEGFSRCSSMRKSKLACSLVSHPLVKAVGFTGSPAAGKALMKLAASRPVPIPCYAEMGSVNPVVRAARRDAQPHAARSRTGLLGSFTLGSGQFCTKPGLVFVPRIAESRILSQRLRQACMKMQPQTMLAANIAEKYASALQARAPRTKSSSLRNPHASRRPGRDPAGRALPSRRGLAAQRSKTGGRGFRPHDHAANYCTPEEMLAAAASLEGHLTATIHGTEEDLAANARADCDPRIQGWPAALQRLPDRRRSMSCNGPRRPVAGDLRWPFHISRHPGHLPLRPAILLSGISGLRATVGTARTESARHYRAWSMAAVAARCRLSTEALTDDH